MTGYAADPANYCYRHPDRQSFILCQRCARTICPECQTPAAVGVICPECMRAQRGETPRPTGMPRQQYSRPFSGGSSYSSRPGAARRVSRLFQADQPYMTYSIMAAEILIYFLAKIPAVYDFLSWSPAYFAPWRAVTPIFVTTNLISVLFNMLTLWFMGRVIEQLLGHWRYLIAFVLSGMAGGAVMELFSPFVLGQTWYLTAGAYGSIFGLFGVLMVIQRRLGASVAQMLGWVAVNLALNLFLGSWQTIFIALGGLAGGALVGLIYAETRSWQQRNKQITWLVVFAVVLFAIACFPMVVHL